MFATPRFTLHEFAPSDAASLLELNADPEVVRFTGDPPFASLEAAREFLLAYDQYRKHGMGRWAVRFRGEGDFVGWCGLKYTPELDEVDLGFRLLRRFWGQGIATETGAAALHYGFDHLSLVRIVGRAMQENRASIRVLEKLGMRPVVPESPGDWVTYFVERSNP